MKRSVIGYAMLAAGCCLASSACVKPIGRTTPEDANRSAGERASDIATQPLKDVNLAEDVIPAKLRAIRDDPYTTSGIAGCAAIGREVAELNALLPPDVDAQDTDGKRGAGERALNVGEQMLLGLIPFRGVIREVSGANDARREYLAAITAGLARRSFLKGVGKERGCKPPAAPGVTPLDYTLDEK